MTFTDHFSQVATQYAAYRPTYPDALFQWLAEVAPARRLAWDCACGSGQATASLARYFDRIIATDASEAQIKAAKPDPKIDYRVATAEASGITEKVDLITVAQAAHWFNHDRFNEEVRRVTNKGSVIALWAYEFLSLDDVAIMKMLKKFYSEKLKSYWPDEIHFVASGYRSLPFPSNEITPPPFTMQASWTMPQLCGYFRSWSATARYVKANSRDPVTDLEKELVPLWGNPETPRSIHWPVTLRVARI